MGGLCPRCKIHGGGIMSMLQNSWRERSGSVVECLGRGFEPHRRHCVVVLEQDTFILA